MLKSNRLEKLKKIFGAVSSTNQDKEIDSMQNSSNQIPWNMYQVTNNNTSSSSISTLNEIIPDHR